MHEEGLFMKIVFYDFSSFRYASFFLSGFIENAAERGYTFSVSHSLPPELFNLGLESEWLHNRKQTKSLFRCENGGQSFFFCLDGSNLNGEPPRSGYSEPLLQLCKYYFKVNYNQREIANNPTIAPFAEKIKPMPLIFPFKSQQRWRFLPKITPFDGGPWPMPKIKQRLRWLRKMPGMKEYQKLRKMPKDIDLFFVSTYYRADKHEEQNKERLAVVEALHKHKNLNLVVGFASNQREIPGEYAKYKIPYMSYAQYLTMLARSRVGLYVRGSHGCLSSKFGEQMALGKPIVGETILNNTENLYAYDRFDEQFAYDDPRQLVERIGFLLGQPSKLRELEKANTETFDRCLAPRPVIANVLNQIENEN